MFCWNLFKKRTCFRINESFRFLNWEKKVKIYRFYSFVHVFFAQSKDAHALEMKEVLQLHTPHIQIIWKHIGHITYHEIILIIPDKDMYHKWFCIWPKSGPGSFRSACDHQSSSVSFCRVAWETAFECFAKQSHMAFRVCTVKRQKGNVIIPKYWPLYC